MHAVHGLRAPWRRHDEEGMGTECQERAGRRTLSSPRQINIQFQQRAQQRRACPRGGNAWPEASFAAVQLRSEQPRVQVPQDTHAHERSVPIISGEVPQLVYPLSPIRHQASSLPSSPRRSVRGMRPMQSAMSGTPRHCQKSSACASLPSSPEGSAFCPLTHDGALTSRPSTVSFPSSRTALTNESRPATVSSFVRAVRLPLAPVTPGMRGFARR